MLTNFTCGGIFHGYIRMDHHRSGYCPGRGFLSYPKSHDFPMPKVRRNLRAEEVGNGGDSYTFNGDAEMSALRTAQYDETGRQAKISIRQSRRNRL